ncbi:MAG: pyridoxal phosphate-dependent aminotransferase family protein [Clostridia bacterium]|nr:pyridoxal phosphate-dependent aminotransferase family protein [Clostridia bacterium]
MIPLFKKCKAFTLADEYRQKGIYPYFHVLESRQDTEVVMEGKRRIMLGSNNYLGLTVDPRVVKAADEAVLKYGTGCSGSRFLNGTLDLHTRLEKELAEFLGYGDAVTFSTGFQSNLGIISAICGRGDYIFNDKENHASVYDGCKLSYATTLRFRHNDMQDLEKQLASVPEDAGKLIITDGVFSMTGEICKLPEIVALAKKYSAAVMVDDAHGLGVLGKGGRGTPSYFGLEKDVDIVMGTFSKSLASLGGYMAASAEIVDYVRHNSRPFIFSASIPPAMCATALAALDVIRKEPETVARLASLSSYMKKRLIENGVRIKESPTPIIPIYTRDAETTLTVAKALFDRGVYVNPVLPPATPPTDCLLRASLMASHTEALIDEAVGIISTTLKEYGI